MPCPFDRASDKLWEESNEKGEVEEITCWLHLFPVDVYSVAHCLEGIERYANGEDYFQKIGLYKKTKEGEKVCQAGGKEAEVLEKSQYREVDENTEEEEAFSNVKFS